MIRRLLATTAIATVVATGAFAQATAPAPSTTAPAAAPEAPRVIKAEGNLATNIIGATVYNGTGDDAENIGEVNDIVLGPDGTIDAIVVGVGGFLGIGEKNVALQYDVVEWTERDGDRWLVVETTQDALKAQPDFDRNAFEPMPADAEVAEVKPATKEDLDKAPVNAETNAVAPAGNAVAPAGDAAAPAAGGGMAATDSAAPAANAPADSMANNTNAAPATDSETTAAIDRSTLEPLDAATISADDFVGTTVYGMDDENIGEIGDVVMEGDKVDSIVIDVGGFLGIGEKPVAVGMDNLEFMTDKDGNRYLYTQMTKEQLEGQPAYDESTWAEKRDEQRMVVPN